MYVLGTIRTPIACARSLVCGRVRSVGCPCVEVASPIEQPNVAATAPLPPTSSLFTGLGYRWGAVYRTIGPGEGGCKGPLGRGEIVSYYLVGTLSVPDRMSQEVCSLYAHVSMARI